MLVEIVCKDTATDGTVFGPRKRQGKQLRQKNGRIKRQAMFAKLRTARHLKLQPTPQGVDVGFQGRSAAIADIHQYGKSDHPAKNSPYKVQYPQRELLGFTEQDKEMIEILILQHLEG